MTDTVDLFAGPGGLDIAARRLGLDPIGIEHDPAACAIRIAAGLATIEGDVTHYGPEHFPEARNLVGGPPCQTFSATGNGKGRRQLDDVLDAVETMGPIRTVPPREWDDPRTALVLQPLRWALRAMDLGRPYRTIVLEQVPAVLPVWEAYARVLFMEGYHVATGVLRAEQYGAPQTRRRAFLIASLDGPVSLPEPTHLAPVTMGDTLPHRGPYIAVSNYGTGGDPKKRGRRGSDQPSATITGKVFRTRLIDLDGNELPRYTPSEAGLLQGFPADYPWAGRDIGQQIGNACPVQLGAAVIGAALALTRALTAA